MLYNAANEPDILQEAHKRQNRILDVDYRNIEVDPFITDIPTCSKFKKTARLSFVLDLLQHILAVSCCFNS
jgi:hypothetical protein